MCVCVCVCVHICLLIWHGVQQLLNDGTLSQYFMDGFLNAELCCSMEEEELKESVKSCFINANILYNSSSTRI